MGDGCAAGCSRVDLVDGHAQWLNASDGFIVTLRGLILVDGSGRREEWNGRFSGHGKCFNVLLESER